VLGIGLIAISFASIFIKLCDAPSLVIAAFSGASLIGYSLKTYLLFVAIALIPQVIGHTAVNWSLKYFTATAVAVIILGEPIGASILALVILGEELSLVKISGGVIILVGVIIASLAEPRKEPTKIKNKS
jgi:drug/metabolite transporter (DMT)-like permease